MQVKARARLALKPLLKTFPYLTASRIDFAIWIHTLQHYAVQVKARARITLKPLVETIPCLGAVNISLLDVPTVDLALMLINHLDIMALPGLNFAVNLGLKLV